MSTYWKVATLTVGLVGCVVWNSLVQGTNVFPDPDAFYHIGMAEHFEQFSLASQFTGLQPTTLGKHFVDQHWLFHAALKYFVSWFGPLFGTKLLTIFVLLSIICLASYASYVFSRRGWWATALLLTVLSPWLFRMHLVKAAPLALIWLLVALILLQQKKERWLLAVGILYVWTHGGFILLPLIVGAWCTAAVLLQRRITLVSYYPVLYSLLGIALALLVNPTFPHNLYFYWAQLVQIGAVNYQSSIGVGGEWYPYQPGVLWFGHGLVAMIWLTSSTIQLALRKHWTTAQLATNVVALALGLLTLKSKRYVEYFSPAFILATVALLPALWELPWQRLTVWLLLPLMPVVMAMTPLILTDLTTLRSDLSDGQQLTDLVGVGTYLNQLPPGQLIAPSDWDDFPLLWRHAPNQQFLIGLDPTFLYLANPARYEAWRQVTLGESEQVPLDLAVIQADYYVVTKDHLAMYRQLKIVAKVVYEDDEAYVMQPF